MLLFSWSCSKLAPLVRAQLQAVPFLTPATFLPSSCSDLLTSLQLLGKVLKGEKSVEELKPWESSVTQQPFLELSPSQRKQPLGFHFDPRIWRGGWHRGAVDLPRFFSFCLPRKHLTSQKRLNIFIKCFTQSLTEPRFCCCWVLSVN